MRRTFPVVVTLVTAFATTPLRAQERAAIQGTITAADTRETVPVARVSVVNPPRSALTDDVGTFVLRDLPPGVYVVTVTAVGRVPHRRAVILEAGQTATLDATLEPGSLLLSGVVVSATRSPMDARNVAANLSVLSSDQIRASPARETQDLLREISGVELPRMSSDVGSTTQLLAMRGADEGRALVLMDGVPLNDVWGEWIDWSRAPKSFIDRVEVLEGGGSHLYGNGAMGGVVSLFTRTIAPGDYRIAVDGGMRDAKHVFGGFGTALTNALSLSLMGDYGDGGGYRLLATPGAGPVDLPSNAARGNGVARFEYAPSSDVSAYVGAQYFHDDRRVEGRLGRTTRTDASGTFGLTVGSADPGLFTVRAWYRTMQEDQRLSTIVAANEVNRAAENVTTRYHIPTDDRGISVNWGRSDLWRFTHVGAGIDYRAMAGSLDERNFLNIPQGTPTTHFNSAGRQTFRAAYLSGMFAPAERWSVEVSARTDRWSNSDGVTTDDTGISPYPIEGRNAFSPRVGARFVVDSSLSLHVAAYQAFHAPNLSQLYRKSIQNSIVLLPSPELQPEFVMAWETGADWQPLTWVQMKGTIYLANYRDLAATSNGGDRQRTNTLFARSLGAQYSVVVRPVQALELNGSINLDDARVTQGGSSGLRRDTRLPRVPLQRVIMSATYRSAGVGTLMLRGRYEGKSTTTGNRLLKDYRLYDMSYERSIGAGLTLFLALENIYDVAYQVNLAGTGNTALTTLGTPRSIRLGLEAARF